MTRQKFGPDVDAEFNSITVAAGSATVPSVDIGGNGEGFYQHADNALTIAINGAEKGYWNANTFYWRGSIFSDAVGNGAKVALNTNATSTVSTIIPSSSDPDTGIGWAAEDQLSHVAGGVETMRNETTKNSTFLPFIFKSYTVATVPAAASFTGGYIWVSDESGGPTAAMSDGTNWKRVHDYTNIS
jgi:hypothetical protein